MERIDAEKLLLCATVFQAGHVSSWASTTVKELPLEYLSDLMHRDVIHSLAKVFADGLSVSPQSIELKCDKPEGVVQYLNSLPAFTSSMSIVIDNDSDFLYILNLVKVFGQTAALSDLLQEKAAKFSNQQNVLTWSQTEELKTEVAELVHSITHIQDESDSEDAGYLPVGPIAAEVHANMVLAHNNQQPLNLVPCGYPSFRELQIPQKGLLHTIAALSTTGKTAIATNIAVGTAIELVLSGSKGHVAINSMEDNRYNIVSRMIAFLANVNSMEIHSGDLFDKTESEQQRYMKAQSVVQHLFSEGVLILDDTPSITLNDMRLRTSIAEYKYGPRVMGISDYSEMFGTTEKDNKPEHLRLRDIAQNLNKFARKNNSVEWLLTQYPGSETPSMILGDKAQNSRGIFHASRVFIELYNLSMLREQQERFPLFSTKNVPDRLKKQLEHLSEEETNSSAFLLIHKNSNATRGDIRLIWEPQYTLFRDPAWVETWDTCPFNVDFLFETFDLKVEDYF